MSRHDFREVPALDVPMDNSTDAELMMLDCKDSSPNTPSDHQLTVVRHFCP